MRLVEKKGEVVQRFLMERRNGLILGKSSGVVNGERVVCRLDFGSVSIYYAHLALLP